MASFILVLLVAVVGLVHAVPYGKGASQPITWPYNMHVPAQIIPERMVRPTGSSWVQPPSSVQSPWTYQARNWEDTAEQFREMEQERLENIREQTEDRLEQWQNYLDYSMHNMRNIHRPKMIACTGMSCPTGSRLTMTTTGECKCLTNMLVQGGLPTAPVPLTMPLKAMPYTG